MTFITAELFGQLFTVAPKDKEHTRRKAQKVWETCSKYKNPPKIKALSIVQVQILYGNIREFAPNPVSQQMQNKEHTNRDNIH